MKTIQFKYIIAFWMFLIAITSWSQSETAQERAQQARDTVNNASREGEDKAPVLPPLPNETKQVQDTILPPLLKITDSLPNLDLSMATPKALEFSEIDIYYDVELVPQRTNMSCWVAAAAMVVGWRDMVSIDPEEIAEGIGYWNQYHNNGLPPDNEEMFDYWGLILEYPQTYTVQGFAELLENGPLWVATDLSGGGHAVVVAEMQGDGTPDGTLLTIYDPWEEGMTTFFPLNLGSIYERTYTEFVTNQEKLADRELKLPKAFYVAY